MVLRDQQIIHKLFWHFEYNLVISTISTRYASETGSTMCNVIYKAFDLKSSQSQQRTRVTENPETKKFQLYYRY